MALGTQLTYLDKKVSGVWETLTNNYANGTLVVSTSVKTPNVNNPLAVAETFSDATYYGLMGYQAEREATSGASGVVINTNSLKLVLPIINLGGMTYDQFRLSLQTADVALALNGEKVVLSSIIRDDMGNCAVLALTRLESK